MGESLWAKSVLGCLDMLVVQEIEEPGTWYRLVMAQVIERFL